MILGGAFILAAAAASASGLSETAISGAWVCGPYTMSGKGFKVEVTDERQFGSDGSFAETSTATMKADDGRSLTTVTKFVGKWLLAGDIIEIRFASAQFVSSSNAGVSLERGQQNVDAQLAAKNWSKYRVLSAGDTLVTVPVESRYKEAEVEVTCKRA